MFKNKKFLSFMVCLSAIFGISSVVVGVLSSSISEVKALHFAVFTVLFLLLFNGFCFDLNNIEVNEKLDLITKKMNEKNGGGII